jgi:S1-C subfamily serine protease
LVEVDGQPVKTTGDVKVALWNKKPGERVTVRVRRKRTTQTFEADLTAAS